MHTFEPSKKLADYFEGISSTTGRKIKLQETTYLGLSGMKASFSKHPTDILITFDPSKYQSQQELEQSLAHEATHGLLLYGRNYHTLTTNTKLSELDIQKLGLLATMIDDVVVNKIIHEKGFEPYAHGYLDMLVKETKAARKGADIYRDFSYDSSVKEKFMVFRYILAWGFLKYFDLNIYAKRTIKKFLNTFEKAYPKQFEVASKIKGFIKDNNIFTSEGHFTVMQKCLHLWGMDDKVSIEYA